MQTRDIEMTRPRIDKQGWLSGLGLHDSILQEVKLSADSIVGISLRRQDGSEINCCAHQVQHFFASGVTPASIVSEVGVLFLGAEMVKPRLIENDALNGLLSGVLAREKILSEGVGYLSSFAEKLVIEINCSYGGCIVIHCGYFEFEEYIVNERGIQTKAV